MIKSGPVQPGQRIGAGRFVLNKPLGRGGMGEVWLAQDNRLNEPVALKFLPPEVRADPAAIDDLRRETARSHRLAHPNIVRIYDLHEHEGEPAFISMEYVEGPTLTAWRVQQDKRLLPWEQLQPLVKHLCEALDYAHGEKVIHRDLKPSNLMLDSKGRLKLADFGIAAVVCDSVSRVSAQRTSGTLAYMSPQQLEGRRAQATDDIYALGATLYELLTSKPPFYTGDIGHQVLQVAPVSLEERLADLELTNDIPPDVAALVMACLGKDAAQRPQSARAVAEWIGLKVESEPRGESLASELASGPAEVDAVAVEPRHELIEARLSQRWRYWEWAVGVMLVLLVGSLAAWKLFLTPGRSLTKPAGGQVSSAPPADHLPAVEWVRQIGGPGDDGGHMGLAADAAGNAYVCGHFSDGASFGSTTLSSVGGKDAFLCKYNASGALQWVRTAGGSGEDSARAVAMDESGDCLVTGRFTGMAQFGDRQLKAAGKEAIFLARFDRDGNIRWVDALGGNGPRQNVGIAIAVNQSGDCYVAGCFSGVITDGTTRLVAGGQDEGILLAKYDRQGKRQWLRNPADGFATGVVFDRAGGLFLAGRFPGQTSFGQHPVVSTGGVDFFIARCSVNGDVRWVRTGGGSGFDAAVAIAASPQGECYVSGIFQAIAEFGGQAVVAADEYDTLLAKYGSDGTLISLKKIKEGRGTVPWGTPGVVCDDAGNVCVAGQFSGVASVAGTPISSGGANGVFLAQYDKTGVLGWVRQGSGTEAIECNGLALGAGGSLYFAGVFKGTAVFDAMRLTSRGDSDAFLVRFSPASAPVAVPPAKVKSEATPASGAAEKATGTSSAASEKAGPGSVQPSDQLPAIRRARESGQVKTTDGWIVLFDGKSTEAWRGFNRQSFPGEGWVVEDGALKTTASAPIQDLQRLKNEVGWDLVSKERFKDFVLEFEWRVSAKGDSGVFYNVVDESKLLPSSGGAEMQIGDDGHPQAQNRKLAAGAAAHLFAPGPNRLLRPVGQYNQARIVMQGGQVEHWLNGQKIVEYAWGGQPMREAYAKLSDSMRQFLTPKMDGYGGHIALQHAYAGEVGYRNIRIRRL